MALPVRLVAGPRFVTDAVENVIAKFVSNLKEAMGDESVAGLAQRAGITPETLAAILSGRQRPTFADIALLESAVDAELWPGPFR